jgi:hypothetical protein
MERLSNHSTDLRRSLVEAAVDYRTARASDDLWRQCRGKEVSRSIALDLGLVGPVEFESRATKLWSSTEHPPDPVRELRALVAGD